MPRRPADFEGPDLGSYAVDPSAPAVPQVYEALRKRILSLDLKPDDPVSEGDLARAAGISRTPARQVIKQLVAENLLEAFPNRGTFVARMNRSRLDDALLVRRQLETELARQTASQPDRDALVQSLRDTLQQHEDALNSKISANVRLIDEEFHRTICGGGSDSFMWKILEQTRTEAMRLNSLSRKVVDNNWKAFRQHIAIVDAIEAGDPTASSKAMAAHLRFNEQVLDDARIRNPRYFVDHSEK